MNAASPKRLVVAFLRNDRAAEERRHAVARSEIRIPGGLVVA